MNVSAQSPPCSRKASPFATWASCSCSRTISDGTVTGGTLSNTVRIANAWSAGQVGCWAAGLASAASSRVRRSVGSGGSDGSWSIGMSTVQFIGPW
ncbi:Uncharacterised protein [Mycobacterium tuberculosis]|uniref:Uncharacterized protein n=1 Tax=Mycobacterium tuberculosis TaxID=1773 RepID=A0A655ICV3_MYCTX|nr:Uncharacterised protein [Mycobacterium tuberculosis]COV72721.1 Uncharacterised protein [Mycobacterium tuberculosis]